MMTEEQFYKRKIFQKESINEIKKTNPALSESIDLWYGSARYAEIQKRKSFLINKLKQVVSEDGDVSFSEEQLYDLFLWWEKTPKRCHYCSLPENELEHLHNLPGHVNKRYPKRGNSLEIDRKISESPYTKLENLVLACYWCNNAKTDTFTEAEFLKIGRIFREIWEDRLGRKY